MKNTDINDETKAKVSNPITVRCRVIFLKIEDVNTRNENFTAEVFIECSWVDEKIIKTLTSRNEDRRHLDVLLDRIDYNSSHHWTPELFLVNAINIQNHEVRHKMEIIEKTDLNGSQGKETTKSIKNTKEAFGSTNSNYAVLVTEIRKIKALFYERLELYDFPMDMQELSVRIASNLSTDEVVLVDDPKKISSIEKEGLMVQQEWDQFDSVKTAQENFTDKVTFVNKPQFIATTFIARKPQFYIFNAYFMIFLITVLGFTPFAFAPASPQFRCQVTGLLLLTAVNFRWIITQKLPPVSYLTSLDKYAIGCLFHLVLFCSWHATISSDLISTDVSFKKRIDTYVLMGSAGFFVFFNLCFVLWFLIMLKTMSNFRSKTFQNVPNNKD